MSEFRDKVSQLSNELRKAQEVLASEKCMSTTMIIACVVPIVVFLVLFFTGMKYFQKDDEAGASVRDVKKIFLWTGGITALSWGGLFAYSKYYC